jgi:Na+-translocating ferredoxin:NAD+ oxidoreductase RnfG subunit
MITDDKIINTGITLLIIAALALLMLVLKRIEKRIRKEDDEQVDRFLREYFKNKKQ